MNKKPAYRCRHGHTTAHPVGDDVPRWVYWAQGRLVRRLIAADKDLAHLDADDLAAYLKTRNLVVVCGLGTLTVEAASPEPPEDVQAEAVVGPAQLQPAPAQEELPLQAAPWLHRRQPPGPSAMDRQAGWKSNNPHQSSRET